MVLALTLSDRVEYGLYSPAEAGDPGVLVHDYRSGGPGECGGPVLFQDCPAHLYSL